MNDPLAAYAFFESPKNYYEAHLHEILGSFAFYQLLFWVSPLISKLLFGQNYNKLNAKNKINFDIHIVSMIQSVSSIAVIIPLLLGYVEFDNNVTDYREYPAFVSAITTGYFIWDLIICLRYFKMFGIGFLGHALASLFVFTQTLRPFCLGWVSSFLLFELSTPFVNINWFINKLPADYVSSTFQTINGLLLMSTFFFVRIVWGFFAIYLVSLELFANANSYPFWLPFGIISLNLGLDVLNVYWFQKMVQIALKKFSKTSDKHQPSDKLHGQ